MRLVPWILGEIQTVMYREKHGLEKSQSGLFHLLALDEHRGHVLHVYWIVLVDFLQ